MTDVLKFFILEEKVLKNLDVFDKYIKKHGELTKWYESRACSLSRACFKLSNSIKLLDYQMKVLKEYQLELDKFWSEKESK